MKRCPECRRDYTDDTLLYCLEDGVQLLQGSVPISQTLADEPATALLHTPDAAGDAPTRAQIHTTDQTAVLPRGAEAEPQKNVGDSSEKRSFSVNKAATPLVIAGIAVLLLIGGFFGYRYFMSAGGEQINSVAVLPFENSSGSTDTDYLSDGLADSLIYRLSQLPNLKVSPTSSVMRYKGSSSELSQIAKTLNVDAIMSGRLVQRGDSLNISVQLIDARTEKLIWAEQYDRKMSDLLATQREIATAITEKLQLKLAGAETKGITKRYTDSNEAYQLYLKGRFHFAKRTKDDIQRSIGFYQQAIALDPNFALAYARISEAYGVMPLYPYLSPKEAIPNAKAAAQRALEIDPTLAEAHTAMATSLVGYDWNWTDVEREFKRAIELDPNSTAAHFRYGQYLTTVGRSDEAIAEVKRALELEPLDITMGAYLARIYLDARQNDKALEQGKKTYELERSHPVAVYNLALVYNANGMYVEAIDISEKALQNDPTSQHMLQNAGYAYARSGRRDKAEEIINRFEDIEKTTYVAPSLVATIYAALGNKDKAFAELEKAYKERDWFFTMLKVDPLMDSLRDDPRFKDLLKRLNLPE